MNYFPLSRLVRARAERRRAGLGPHCVRARVRLDLLSARVHARVSPEPRGDTVLGLPRGVGRDRHARSESGAFYTQVPIRPRLRGARRSLRTFAVVYLRPPLDFNARPRRLSTPADAFELHPDVALYGMALSVTTPSSRSRTWRRTSARKSFDGSPRSRSRSSATSGAMNGSPRSSWTAS